MCGTCKRDRVLAHQAAGRAVVFIGDGESDRYAAGYTDVVFAKRSLVRICLEAGWPFLRWTEFREIDAWLAATLDAWRADPSPAGPIARPTFCGPELGPTDVRTLPSGTGRRRADRHGRIGPSSCDGITTRDVGARTQA